jgi:hypothetical protein
VTRALLGMAPSQKRTKENGSLFPKLKPLNLSEGDIYIAQWVTKRCHLSWLTNSAFVFEPKCGGGRGELWVLANEYSCTQEPKYTFEI